MSAAPEARLGLLRKTLMLGSAPAFVAGMGVALWTLVAPPVVLPEVVVALTVTAMLCAFVSPIQDHVRHMLHVADASWGAAVMSGVMVGATLLAIWLFAAVEVPAPWVPLGALASANLLSLGAGLWLARGHAPHPNEAPKMDFGTLIHAGRWLLVVALLPTGAAFAAAALVVHLAGPAAMGYAEAGRVLGQPPWVLSMGLAAVLGPRSVRAVRRGDRNEARSVSRLFAGIMLLAGLPYLALVGIPWSWSPLPGLVPNAYYVPHLLVVSILANMVIGMDWPYRSELIGAGRASTLARLEAVANSARISVAGLAGTLGSFAIPVGYLVHALVRSVGYRITLRRLYHASAAAPPVPEWPPLEPVPEPALSTGESTRPAL